MKYFAIAFTTHALAGKVFAMRCATSPTKDDFHALVEHFLALSPRDRILRFGRLVSAADICSTVESILRNPRDALLVHEPMRDLAGVMHMSYKGSIALLGLSVASWARGQGIGSLLLQRAVLFAQLRETKIVYVRKLSSNPEMRRLAQRMGLNVAWSPNASCTQLELPLGTANPFLGRRGEDRLTLADKFLCASINSIALGSARKSADKQLPLN